MTRSTALVAGFAAVLCLPNMVMAQTARTDIVSTYIDIAHAVYEDSLITARDLKAAVDELVANPTEDNLSAARLAWIAARVPYQQTEVYRFGNPSVDEWEGRVNAWPLDEGLIDYVDSSYGVESDINSLYAANVIANPTIVINGETVDVAEFTPEVISSVLHEAGQVEANVASGYHAIEFLLWGQDLNGTDAGAGERPATDFDVDKCTNGNCDRRAEYLTAATDLLIADLEEMVGNWEDGGAASAYLLRDTDTALSAILTGIGSLSYGELAGERMKLGLLLHDPEEEHDCFSDNTHASHAYDIAGMSNVWFGTYVRVDGSSVSGPSLANLVREIDADLEAEMSGKLLHTLDMADVMVARAETVEAYDQMIGEGNAEGNKVVQDVIDGLIDQTASVERVVVALDLEGITIEGSDSLDSPDAVFE